MKETQVKMSRKSKRSIRGQSSPMPLFVAIAILYLMVALYYGLPPF